MRVTFKKLLYGAYYDSRCLLLVKDIQYINSKYILYFLKIYIWVLIKLWSFPTVYFTIPISNSSTILRLDFL